MNFRRQPFQFSTIDPVKRQAELQKRFGLPTSNSDMFVDFGNSGMLGSGLKEPSPCGSPRLQHRVPLFTGSAEKANSKQNNVDTGHKPKVRVVPIQVEGVDSGARYRTPSGLASTVDNICKDKFQPLNSFNADHKIKNLSQPKVCTIPVKVEESRNVLSQPKVCTIPVKVEESREDKHKVDPCSQAPEPAKKLKSELNGCPPSTVKNEEPDFKSVLLKKIEVVLNKLGLYKSEVEKFTGTPKDKQYRYLDEMLTRCMLDLDDIDSMGLDEVRKARKEAVRQVQHYVDLLDTKVNECESKTNKDSSVNSGIIPVSEQTSGDILTSETVSSNVMDDSSDIPNECDEVKMNGDIDNHKQINSDCPTIDNESVSSDIGLVNSNNALKECDEVKISGDSQIDHDNKIVNDICDLEMAEKVPSISEESGNEVSMENAETELDENDGSCISETKLQSTSNTSLDSEMKVCANTSLDSEMKVCANTSLDSEMKDCECDGSPEFVMEEVCDNLENLSDGCTFKSKENGTDSSVTSDIAQCDYNDKIPVELSSYCAPVVQEDETVHEKP